MYYLVCVPNGEYCAEGWFLDIFRDHKKMYTMEECRQICANYPECDSFSVGYDGYRACVTFRAGCTPRTDSGDNRHFYFLSDCGMYP